MPMLRDGGPWIWVTWLTKPLAGETSCEWASWFKSQYDGKTWTRAPSDFDEVTWKMGHTELLHRLAADHRQQGFVVTLEDQNQVTLRGQIATVSGRPDLVARDGNEVRIVDAKTGRPKASDSIQVMLYMYFLPLARPEYKGCTITGQVAYQDHVVDIPAHAVNQAFIDSLRKLIGRLGGETPALRVPSGRECRYCDITAADCPDRMEQSQQPAATTDQF